VIDAVRVARELYGLDAVASALPSERDRNFLLTATSGERFVLKIANAAEERSVLEAQNAAMAHVAARGFARCPRALPTRDGNSSIAQIHGDDGRLHFVRLVTWLEGIPLVEVIERPPALLEDLGRRIGELDAALADFDHPAIHRDFHWDLANAAKVIRENLALVRDGDMRSLVADVSTRALSVVEPRAASLRRSAIHNDANDWNILVGGISNPNSRIPNPTVSGIIDFGDMVHSWTVADLAIAIAYAVLDAPDPLVTANAIARGYSAVNPLDNDEAAVLFPLVCLRLSMSVCIAARQQQGHPDNEYLAVSQKPIRRTLPKLRGVVAL
jgi:Ser/Thr protein kinase RdoA (MazF antagonist)